MTDAASDSSGSIAILWEGRERGKGVKAGGRSDKSCRDKTTRFPASATVTEKDSMRNRCFILL